jgi:hypothetical protein
MASLADFSWLRFVGGVDLFGGFLKELADELCGGFENGGAQEFLKIGHDGTAGLGGAEGGYEFLDFLFLGEGIALGVWRFFLVSALRSCRDISETSLRCSSTSCWKIW